LNLPRLHLVTDATTVEEPSFAAAARRLLQRFGPSIALHLRIPGGSGASVYAHAMDLRPTALAAGAPFLVNDRVDVAMAVRADGIQLGEGSVRPERVRALVGHAWIGASTHSATEALHARASGLDFVLLGTIHVSPTHPGARVLGEPALVVAARAAVPVLGIGGMTPPRAAAARGLGAHGVAVLSGVWRAADPERAVAEYLTALEVAND
jgi:thiamine-phosphate diphosphorylase